MTPTISEFLERVIDERDRQYQAQFTAADRARDTALAAQKELTAAAFDASEKAIARADVNAEKWRQNANEWRASMLDRENRFASRIEVETEIKALRAEIAGLRESRAEGGGRSLGSHAMWGYVVGAVGFALSVLSLIGLVLKFGK
jgi:hypothetical protein